ncbi:MAG TPA: glycosyltransferase family 4 protein [Nitrospiria bacterium]|jgi:UDP-glucose:(heptosyl)LPS alpha-1,3-glucosyltransferase|nr:glycosyltransferase family 4 protein [Nitrospiria bacterium]
MKIAMLTKHFNFRNGSSRSVHEVAVRLTARGHEVHIFCNRRPDSYPPRPVLRHVPTLPLGSWARTLTFDWGCRRRIHAEPFDIVHGHGNTIEQDVVTVRICRKANRVARGLSLSRWDPHLWMESRQLSNPRLKRIIALSGMVKKDLQRYYGIASGRIVTIPNGVDAARFHPNLGAVHRDRVRTALGLSKEDFAVLFIASGNYVNRGLLNVLSMVKQRPLNGLKLVVAGGDRPGLFRDRARDQGIEERLIFLPFTDRIEELHSGMDALIFPSYYDTFGNVPLEAMASGLPVIVTAQCGVSELITHGRDGLILKHTEDLDGMAAALGGLMDGERRARIGRAARVTAERYSWDSVAERTLEVYSELIPSGRTT